MKYILILILSINFLISRDFFITTNNNIESIKIINEFRIKNNLHKLNIKNNLIKTAEKHLLYMYNNNEVDHIESKRRNKYFIGKHLKDRVIKFNYFPKDIQEYISYKYTYPEIDFLENMKNIYFRSNVLSTYYMDIGVGFNKWIYRNVKMYNYIFAIPQHYKYVNNNLKWYATFPNKNQLISKYLFKYKNNKNVVDNFIYKLKNNKQKEYGLPISVSFHHKTKIKIDSFEVLNNGKHLKGELLFYNSNVFFIPYHPLKKNNLYKVKVKGSIRLKINDRFKDFSLNWNFRTEVNEIKN